MRPPAAAAPAPGQQAAYSPAVSAVPQATSVGTPVARAAVLTRPPAARPFAVAAAQPPIALPVPLHLAEQPPAPAPVLDAVERQERSIRVGQIVSWQLALVMVGAATAGSRAVLILTAVAAVSLVLLTAVRFRGMWLYRWAAVLLAYLARHRHVDLAGDTAINLVSVFCGRTSTTSLTVREQPYGVLSRPDGASVALRVGADAQYEMLPRLGSLADSADE
jgi:hypothetical protein